jgi:protein O-GlcNAc transferase
LHGHMGGLRILVFARRAAPIQVTYLGYQATTGMAAMDYRLTDSQADPCGMTEALHTERLFRLDPAFFCYKPPEESPRISESPAIQNCFVTFGSFNAVNKITISMLHIWSEILKRTPRSKLRILVPDSAALQQRIGMTLVSKGVKPAQVEFVIRTGRKRYLERLAEVDIALDPYPFNGHTTSCDALWMGLPVVMMRGESYVQRYGSTSLIALGLEEFIAEDTESYIAIACQLAADTDRLSLFRKTLRDRMASSVLMNYPAFADRLGKAYRDMWKKHVDS